MKNYANFHWITEKIGKTEFSKFWNWIAFSWLQLRFELRKFVRLYYENNKNELEMFKAQIRSNWEMFHCLALVALFEEVELGLEEQQQLLVVQPVQRRNCLKKKNIWVVIEDEIWIKFTPSLGQKRRKCSSEQLGKIRKISWLIMAAYQWTVLNKLWR